jgi:hypothetical protein
MAWTYEQDFESLSDGDLNGQDSWSGNTGYDVQSSVAYAGSKGVSITIADSQAISRALPANITDGDVYFAIRRTTNSGGGAFYVILQDSAPASRIFIRMHSDGNIGAFNNGVGYVTIAAYSANTWYPVNVQFNDGTQPDQFRVRVYSGGSWGSFSSWLTVNGGSYVNIGYLRFDTSDGNNSAVGYVDAFSASDITGVVAAGQPTMKRWAGVPHMGGRTAFGRNSGGWN